MKDEKFIKKWEKERQKGIKKYVLTYAFYMGIALFIGSGLAKIFLYYFTDEYVVYDIYMHIAYFIGGFVGGIFGANLRWGWNEEKYNKLTNNTKT